VSSQGGRGVFIFLLHSPLFFLYKQTLWGHILRVNVEIDSIHIYTMYRETTRVLDQYVKLAEEGKACEESSRFARWLLWSRVPDFVAAYERTVDSHPALVVDSKALSKKIQFLVQACSPHMQGAKPAPTISQDSLVSIHDKLDLLLGLVTPVPQVCLQTVPKSDNIRSEGYGRGARSAPALSLIRGETSAQLKSPSASRR